MKVLLTIPAGLLIQPALAQVLPAASILAAYILEEESGWAVRASASRPVLAELPTHPPDSSTAMVARAASGSVVWAEWVGWVRPSSRGRPRRKFVRWCFAVG